MKIENNSERKVCLFGDIKQGETFLDFEDDVAIKTSSEQFNAVYLGNGSITRFADDCEVERINAKVVIE